MHSKYSYEDSPSHLNSTPLSSNRKTLGGDDKEKPRSICYLQKKTRHGLMAFAVAVLTFALLAWYYVTQHGRLTLVAIGPMRFDPVVRTVTLVNVDGQTVFRNKVAVSMPEEADVLDCLKPLDNVNSVCLHWINVTTQDESPVVEMSIEYVPQKDNIQCINVDWTSLRMNYSPQDCISLNGSHWYGGAEVRYQQWVLNKLTRMSMQPFVMRDIIAERNTFGSVLERYWLSSSGIAVVVSKDAPLHVSINDKPTSRELCFKAEYLNSPYQNPANNLASLSYTVCIGEDVRKVHEYVLQNFFLKLHSLPDERMIRLPVWSTWSRYKVNVTETAVLGFAGEIDHHGFPKSRIVIDDKYMSFYGEADFDETKFPSARKMIQDLHQMGFRVSAWMNPFANINSQAFHFGVEHSYWMRDPRGRVPALIEWWNGVGGTLDVTNINAREWFINRLQKMQRDYGLDSFKFDAGETSYIPVNYNATIPFNDPNLYCTKYVNLVATINNQITVRCGHQTQDQPIFLQLMYKDSNWSYNNGLLTIIPSILLRGILGYPFILPDVIGGSGYTDTDFRTIYKPDRELYIRWAELTAYLPAMQFSIAPWLYDDEVVRIAKKMVRIHEQVVTPIILNISDEVIVKGYPIIRPLWWIAPADNVAQYIDSEFLIGDRFLVAPVLTKHDRKRDVYLPPGKWKEELREENVFEGGRWLPKYPVDIDEVATFLKV